MNHTRVYLERPGAALAQVIIRYAGQEQIEAFVFSDGLPKSLQQPISRSIKIPQIAVKRIRGLTADEDEFIRLADSLCGIAREAQEGDAGYQRALAALVQRGAGP